MPVNSGRLGSAAIAAAASGVAYLCPAATTATANIRVVNRGAQASKLRVAISTAATYAAVPDDAWIEYDAVLPAAGGVIENTGQVIGAGERVFVSSATSAVSVRVHGFEKAVA